MSLGFFDNTGFMFEENENKIEKKKLRGLDNMSGDLLEMFLLESDIHNHCDFYFCGLIGRPADYYCNKIGINYFNSPDMYSDVLMFIEVNKNKISNDIYVYIKDRISVDDFKIVVEDYLSCDSELFKVVGSQFVVSKEEAFIRDFAINYVNNVSISVAYRYLWSCIYGS